MPAKLPLKNDPSVVHYRPGTPNRRCGLCLYYRIGGSCTIVEGQIAPEYVCDLFDHVPTAGRN